MGSQRLGAFFGLASALSWGTGDFSGGIAAKRSHVYRVVIASQSAGLLLVTGLALWLPEPVPPRADLLWGGTAGIAGAVGLAALYHGLATGRMGIVAPVNAVVSAAVPVLFGALIEGMPTAFQFLGFGLALLAVWLVSQTGDGTRICARDLGLPILAGLGFGAFLVIIHHTSDRAILWPLAAAKSTSVALLAVVISRVRTRGTPISGWLPLAALAGILDSGGNAFFALAARAGRLDVAAVLSSLFPAVTVLLARLVLKEPVSRRQWIGLLAALIAVLLIAS